MKVLVVKRDKIGDLLLATPMLAHLKASRPQAEVHLLANDYNAWVVEGNPHLDRIWTYRRVRSGDRVRLRAAWDWLRQRQALRRERFDWVIVANGEESPRAIRRALSVRGARTLACCAGAAAYPGLTDPIAPERERHEVERLLAMLAPLGIGFPQRVPDPSYALPQASRAFAQRWLAERRLAPGGYVVLGIGARRPKKQPTSAQVRRWSAWCKERFGLDTVFLWTPGRADDPAYPGDDALAQAVLEARAPHVHPHRGPIQEALGLLWSARTSVFPDSGLMHFAAASPGGVLGLFAETDVSPAPAQWAPRGPRARWLEAARSVAELSDETVFSRLEPLLN